ncbi:carbohydrate-binding domain-containing protein [Runella aurantiaca]|nr:carbohydrate-binding domain-containing protein [Runella aurantiaca]
MKRMNKKNLPLWMMLTIIASLLIACKDGSDVLPSEDEDSIEVHEADSDYTWNSTDVIPIVLNGTSITANNAGVSVAGAVATIKAAGTYSISGTLTNGQIVVNNEDKGVVRIILNGVDITSSNSAAIYIKKAGKALVVLADNTQNKLTDGATYVYDIPADEEPNAALFSKADLTIFGNGALTVTGKFNDGIASKDGLIIKSGTLNVTAADDGIRGKDYLIIKDGAINVTAKTDGLKSNNDENTALGYIIIEKGTMTISAGDDGIHAESKLTINGGNINITKSYEGIESKIITVNDGTIHIVSSDDGLNAAGGSSESATASGSYYFYMNGGYIWMDANGDGVDVNGTAEMTGGVIIVNGTTANNNAAVDYDRSFKITGGYLLAVGSSGMAQIPGTSSTQNSVLITLTTAQQAGSLVHIQDSEGKDILTFKSTKKYQSVAFSSPELKKDTSYDVFLGGSSTGTVTDGLYKDGIYTSGTKAGTVSITSVATKVKL